MTSKDKRVLPADAREVVTQYWLEYYCDGHCTLCGNKGVIDTRSAAFTYIGWPVGRLNFCICPNGQALRANGKSVEQVAVLMRVVP